MIELLKSPWFDNFDSLISRASSSLVISSPYIGKEPCRRVVVAHKGNNEAKQISMLLLTDLSRNTLLSGATDVSAICDIADSINNLEVRFLPSVHAKVYVADEKSAIVTSGNMTSGGLFRNFEYGMHVNDEEIVKRIKKDITDYSLLGTKIDKTKLKFLSQISAELNDIRVKVEKSVKSRLKTEFEQRLRIFDDEIIRTRAAGRSSHAIFQDAILYLLSQRPMSTAELHPFVQKVHPDLCDDTMERIIDGKHFGKKWKHAVRTAQQHLKKRGLIVLRDGAWHLRD